MSLKLNSFKKVAAYGAFVAFFAFFYFKNNSSSQPELSIALTQIAPHPSLDLIRKGIEDRIKRVYPTIKIYFQDAQGNVSLATQIAQKFISLKPTLFIPITTPSTQTLLAARQKNEEALEIPVVFAAISDPKSARIVNSLEKPEKGVTGVCDFPPLQEQIQLMTVFFNQDTPLRKVGVLFNPGEANSAAIIQSFKNKCEALSIQVVEGHVSTSTNIGPSVDSLISSGVQALYIPNDNTVVTSITHVIEKAKNQKIPVFTSDPQSVQKGAFGALAFDQYKVGVQTGEIALHLLKERHLPKIPIQMAKDSYVTLNVTTARDIGIEIPSSLQKTATLVD